MIFKFEYNVGSDERGACIRFMCMCLSCKCVSKLYVYFYRECLAELSQKDRSKGLVLEETEDIAMKIQQLMEQLASKQEKISQLHLSWKLKKESLQHEVNQRKS